MTPAALASLDRFLHSLKPEAVRLEAIKRPLLADFNALVRRVGPDGRCDDETFYGIIDLGFVLWALDPFDTRLHEIRWITLALRPLVDPPHLDYLRCWGGPYDGEMRPLPVDADGRLSRQWLIDDDEDGHESALGGNYYIAFRNLDGELSWVWTADPDTSWMDTKERADG